MKKALFLFTLLLFVWTNGHAAAFVISAVGMGDSVEEARISAATELGKSIIAKVESTFSTQVAVSDDKVSRDAKSKKDIASSQELKSIQYGAERKVPGGYEVTAGLDQQGVDDNISYMMKSLESNLDLFNRSQLKQALKTIDQLNAFIGAMPKSALTQFSGIHNWVADRREQVLRRLNQGRVNFVSTVDDYSVTVDGKAAVSGQYFEVGDYQYTAKAKGYRAVTGTFNVSKGEILKVSLPFIKELKNAFVDVSLPATMSSLRTDVDEALTDMGIRYKKGADNVIQFRLSDQNRTVEDYKIHRLTLRIVATKNKQQFKKITVRKQVTVEQGETAKREEALKAMIKKGLVALFARMNMDVYFRR